MKLRELRTGDLLLIPAPFEENTRDYYNGYTPEEIRGCRFTDRFGKSSKIRLVLYIVRDGNMMFYCPLTSRHGSTYDAAHQYELMDNSMTITKDPTVRSFVEIDSLRAIRLSYDREILRTGRITQMDLDNILHRLSNRTVSLVSDEDQRGYVSKETKALLLRKLAFYGFRETARTEYRVFYRNGHTGVTVVRNRFGAVSYHVPKTKEEVRRMVEEREGRPITKKEEAACGSVE